MKITKYNIQTPKIKEPITIACVSDLHARKNDSVIDTLIKISPDVILLAGDIFEVSNEFMRERNKNAFLFIESAVKIAPVYYCFGNHEIYFSHNRKEINRVPNSEMEIETVNKIKAIGVNIINDTFNEVNVANGQSILIGGLVCGKDMNPALNINEPNLAFLKDYDREEAFKILICHYPHYYQKYLKSTNFDLILAGHAHGGQWRIFGRGIYSPHQGLFPKYTSGIYENRFIISRGAVNNSRIFPRLFNPSEVLKITVSPK